MSTILVKQESSLGIFVATRYEMRMPLWSLLGVPVWIPLDFCLILTTLKNKKSVIDDDNHSVDDIYSFSGCKCSVVASGQNLFGCTHKQDTALAGEFLRDVSTRASG